MLRFGEIAENKDSMRIPLKEADRDKRHGPFPYYGSVGVIDYVNDYIFEGEHLLISEDGKHLESRNRPITCIATGQFWVNNHAHVLASNGKADLYYLSQHLEMRPIRRFVTGIDQFKLNRGNLDRIPIPVPPIEQQMAFQRVYDHLVNLSEKKENTLEQSDNLFNFLVQRAFRGEL